MEISVAISPALMESEPNSGPTVFSSKIVKGAGKAPALNKTDKFRASIKEKRPVMTPLPLGITELITGALITFLSKIMAKGRPIFARVTSANLRAPMASKLKVT